jgi:hypothetical protein
MQDPLPAVKVAVRGQVSDDFALLADFYKPIPKELVQESFFLKGKKH